jgi:hypothetical protein
MRTSRRSHWLDLADVQRSSAETERLNRELRDAHILHVQLQSALETERIHHICTRRESRAIQTVLEEAYIELQGLKAENAHLRESNSALLAKGCHGKSGLDRPSSPVSPSPPASPPSPPSRRQRRASAPTELPSPAPLLHPFEPNGDDLSTILTPTRRKSAAAALPPPPATKDHLPTTAPAPPHADSLGPRVDPARAAGPAWASPQPSTKGTPALAPSAPAGPADPRTGDEACGVGLRVTEAAPYRVAGCAVGGPAHRGGAIRPGDHLLAVDGQATRGMTPTAVRRRLVGPSGSVVRLQLARTAPAGGAGAAGGEERCAVFEVALVRVPLRAWRPADAAPGQRAGE